MVHKWLFLSCGRFGLVNTRCIQIWQRLYDGDFLSGRGVFNWAGSCAYYAISGYPFIRRTTTPHATHVLKHPGYWCYPGVESRFFMDAWAGRCVLAHLDDCWGLPRRSRASSHQTWHR
ncbi:uncharacterized protein LACBIDRAFT_310423 [Laccaria bicolor S238N-H82]|uniref:Predicted protein n=1 Tax=Laccaria bicolor (strain S238N-H82 / ATCC MYA-4686) TaxID=486041 RepID=B0DUA7_LACBS|nr:uncharacterized protein LACBIDRAFT_310423 [Laccaria bicolor S238N-H82]EDR01768.1 predicted protein [Laccaria bicolor S238N-H82]|eukprot:XP_001887581.1 predicted protein [Laccaria bicolor S238N-H82]